MTFVSDTNMQYYLNSLLRHFTNGRHDMNGSKIVAIRDIFVQQNVKIKLFILSVLCS